MHYLPETGFLRLWQIIGDPKRDPPAPALIPNREIMLVGRGKGGPLP
jgi:hypothetical protein